MYQKTVLNNSRPVQLAFVFLPKVDEIKIKRNVSFFSSTPLSAFSLLFLYTFNFFCFAWSDFKTFRGRQIKVHMSDFL